MAANPEVQAKAQKEIDDVVGTSRMPEYKDLEDLPYLRAVLNEVSLIIQMEEFIAKLSLSRLPVCGPSPQQVFPTQQPPMKRQASYRGSIFSVLTPEFRSGITLSPKVVWSLPTYVSSTLSLFSFLN